MNPDETTPDEPTEQTAEGGHPPAKEPEPALGWQFERDADGKVSVKRDPPAEPSPTA